MIHTTQQWAVVDIREGSFEFYPSELTDMNEL